MKDVAVLMATYNGGQFIRQQLDSLFAQSTQNFRLVVHDDGSTDETVSILQEYYESYKGRMEIIYGSAVGNAMGNFMYLLNEVEADYYFFCDQDDVWLPTKIEDTLKEIQDAECTSDRMSRTPVMVFTDMYVVDANLSVIDDSFIRYLGRDPKNVAYTQVLIDNPAAGTAMGFNRALRDKAVSCETVQWAHVPMHDAWLLEIASIFGIVRSIDKPMVYYRQTGNNIMGATTETTIDKVVRNTSELSQGFFAKKKAFIDEARLFAREILRLKDIPEDKLKVLNEFVHIGSKPKAYRMEFYRRHNFTRAKHNLWMRLWV
ncbi:MAG: glycosyltransferase family 2 protein [Pseudobutyrivibrio sp.]|nr:glycosyltransferase family 2 protein [Pseudobutyrivibrio sp.]